MKLKELLEAVKGTAPETKDIKRINDIIAKAPNDIPKQVILAANMCKAIKDADKMERRYTAAVDVLGADSPVTNVFKQGCIAMGLSVDGEEHEETPDSIEDDMTDITVEQPADKMSFKSALPKKKYNLRRIQEVIRQYTSGKGRRTLGLSNSTDSFIVKEDNRLYCKFVNHDYTTVNIPAIISCNLDNVYDYNSWRIEQESDNEKLNTLVKKVVKDAPLALYKKNQMVLTGVEVGKSIDGYDSEYLPDFFDIPNNEFQKVLHNNSVVADFNDMKALRIMPSDITYNVDRMVYNICKKLNILDVPTDMNPGFKVALITENGFIFTPCVVTMPQMTSGNYGQSVLKPATGGKYQYKLTPGKIKSAFKKTMTSIIATKTADGVVWLGDSAVYIPDRYLKPYL